MNGYILLLNLISARKYKVKLYCEKESTLPLNTARKKKTRMFLLLDTDRKGTLNAVFLSVLSQKQPKLLYSSK